VKALTLSLAILLAGCQVDDDGDGWSVERGDCDDTDPERHPEADEVCNRIDDDCDGTTDENEEVEPLAPGVHGLDEAHAVIVGEGTQVFGSRLYSAGDLTGDRVDDLVAVCRTPVDGIPAVCSYPMTFCAGRYFSTEAGAFILNPNGADNVTLGDVDNDTLTDLHVGGSIYFSPLAGIASEPSLLVPGGVNAMVAADLDANGTVDLVVGDTSSASVRFHRGPFFDGDPGPAVSIRRPGFGHGLAVLRDTDPPLTFVGAGTSVSVIEGLPTEDSETVERRLDLEPLFPDDAIFIGKGLVSDGHRRVCIGTDQYSPVRVVCGTLEELDQGNPSLVIEPRAGTTDEQLGPRLSMTQDLVAAGHPWAPTPALSQGGLVYVRGEVGWWDFEGSESNSFGTAVALLRDPILGVTWLAVAAVSEEPGGAIYLFALDALPTM